MKEQNILLDHIRKYDSNKDKNLPEFSHSRLECLDHCAYQYNLKYNENKTTSDTTLALQLGSICHLALEHKGLMIQQGKVDYDTLEKLLIEGGESDDGHGHTVKVTGIAELKKTYWDSWSVPDTEGHDCIYKLDIFMKILHTEMEEDDGWIPFKFEEPFRYVYKDKAVLLGFIDRIDYRDINGEREYRLVDYKTSKKIFPDNKLPTSQQFAIYEAALLLEYGKTAVKNMYRFICIDDKQYALTNGWEKRFIAHLDKLFDKLDNYKKTNLYPPSPSPLCHFCSYCITNKDATTYKNECPYYMKWTRENKDFSVNQEWNPTVQTRKPIAFDW